MEQLLKMKDLAELLQISPYTIRFWVTQHKIPFVRVGRLIRFRPVEIEAWVKEQNDKDRSCPMPPVEKS